MEVVRSIRTLAVAHPVGRFPDRRWSRQPPSLV